MGNSRRFLTCTFYLFDSASVAPATSGEVWSPDWLLPPDWMLSPSVAPVSPAVSLVVPATSGEVWSPDWTLSPSGALLPASGTSTLGVTEGIDCDVTVGAVTGVEFEALAWLVISTMLAKAASADAAIAILRLLFI
jgi:hypothetical protein